jgi:hypothetical protein
MREATIGKRDNIGDVGVLMNDIDDVEAVDEAEKTKEESEVEAKAASKKASEDALKGRVNRKELDATRLYLREIEGSALLTTCAWLSKLHAVT